MSSLTQISVPFHGAELYIVEHNGQPYTPMKPIVEGMGLDWKGQFIKIKQRFSTSMVEITIQVFGDQQSRSFICLPVRKLAAWLYTISPNKIPNLDTRAKVITYQNECDDVLWDYWTKGVAINPRSTVADRVPLKNAVNLLVAKSKILSYPDAYNMVHQAFGVEHIDEIPLSGIPEAVAYVHRLILGYEKPVPVRQKVAAPVAPMPTLQDGRHFVVIEQGVVVYHKDANDYNLVNVDHVNALKTDMRTVEDALSDLRSRMRILSGEYSVDYLLNNRVKLSFS